MNRTIKIITAAAAAMMITVTSVFAEQWINISSWSYNEVSAFVNAELLPESFNTITDYHQNITREQFCDLIKSVITRTKALYDTDMKMKAFCDTDNESSADYLYSYSIVDGMKTEDKRAEQIGQIYSENNMEINMYFCPDVSISREDAAVIIFRAGRRFGSEVWQTASAGEIYDDNDEISDYATEAVGILRGLEIVTDMSNNKFCPKSNVSIEQAISMVYRMYTLFTKIIYSDYEGAAADGIEREIRGLGDGLSETYDGKALRIKENGAALMEFEADVYSIINCAGYNGKRMAFAVNFNDKTDVYDIDSGELLYTIPYIVVSADPQNGYAYTASSRWYPVLYGVYSMDGYELAEPAYSERELREIETNGFTLTEDNYRDPDGVIYYIDKDDENRLYKVDSNGDGRQRLSDISFKNISYYDSHLYLYSMDENDTAVYIIDADGSGSKRLISEDKLLFPITASKTVLRIMESDKEGKRELFTELDYGNDLTLRHAAEGYAYVTDGRRSELYVIDLNAEQPEAVKLDEGDIKNCVSGDGWLYYQKNEYGDLFRTDGIKIEQVTFGYNISSFGWSASDGRRLLFTVSTDKDSIYEYDTESGDIKSRNIYENTEIISSSGFSDKYSDNNYSIEIKSGIGAGFAVFDNTGTKIYDVDGWLYSRNGNTLLYTYDEGTDMMNCERKLVALELDTGKEEILTNDFYIQVGNYGDTGGFMYSDTCGSVFVYGEHGSEGVYPCRGIHKYGELLSIECFRPDNRLYKLDTDGNLYPLTESEVLSMLYVPNS